MKSVHAAILASLVIAFSAASCVKRQPMAKMTTESKALELAKTEFAKTGRKVEAYGVTMETDTKGEKWIFWFDEKGPYPTPGGKHAVTVEKATGKTAFLPGE